MKKTLDAKGVRENLSQARKNQADKIYNYIKSIKDELPTIQGMNASLFNDY
jgi:hypothetical protein